MTTLAFRHSSRTEALDFGTLDLFARMASHHKARFDTGGPPPQGLPPLVGRSAILRLVSCWRRALPACPRGVEAFKHAGKRALIALLIANFLGYATIGSNGILRWNGYHSQKNARVGELARLTAEQARLAHHVDLLNPASADADLVEEMVRSELGFVRPDEVIIIIP